MWPDSKRGTSRASLSNRGRIQLVMPSKFSITSPIDSHNEKLTSTLLMISFGLLLLVMLIPIPKTESHRGCAITNWALWKIPFDEQYNTFHKFGYAADPSADVANNIIGNGELAKAHDTNSVCNLWQSEHHKRKAQRKAEKKEDQSDKEMDAETVENIQNPTFMLWLLKNSKSPWSGKKEGLQTELTKEQRSTLRNML
ncbi:hypothetical protein L7F22_065829 [Adiantum nelumboides]|nr:hypothetical protein [Adiantum nelumboides]